MLLSQNLPVVKKETGRVSAITGIGLLIMWIVFGVLHAFMPQKVPDILNNHFLFIISPETASSNLYKDMHCSPDHQE